MHWNLLRSKIHFPQQLSVKLKGVFNLFSESISGWSRNQASIYAGALAYYTIFSLAPLVIISVSIPSLVFNQVVVMGTLTGMIEDLVGPEVAQLVVDILISSMSSSHSTRLVAALISLGVMLYAASLIFFKLQVSLNAMWDIMPKTENVSQNVMVVVRNGLLSTAAALSSGLYLLVALVLNNLWSALPTEFFQELFPGSENWVALLSFVVSPVMYMVPFAIIYKYLPQAKVRWRDVWPGTALAAVLFWIGGQFIGLYLTRSGATSVYGAAGSLVAFLIWVFYSAMVFLFGAKFIQVYSGMYGVPVEPDEDAMFRPDVTG